MCLAEDRILSLGIYCQQDRKYYLEYIPDAFAFTDPMKSHEQLMIQRRRWINSSYFAFFYVFRNYYYNAMESNHGFFRKYVLLRISMLVAFLSFLNGWLPHSSILSVRLVYNYRSGRIELCYSVWRLNYDYDLHLYDHAVCNMESVWAGVDQTGSLSKLHILLLYLLAAGSGHL